MVVGEDGVDNFRLVVEEVSTIEALERFVGAEIRFVQQDISDGMAVAFEILSRLVVQPFGVARTELEGCVRLPIKPVGCDEDLFPWVAVECFVADLFEYA